MDLKNVLNDVDEEESRTRQWQRPSQTPHNLPPPLPSLQTSRSSHTPSAFPQGSPAGPTPYGRPPYLERRSSSFASQHSHIPAGTPATPHTPGSGITYPPPRQYSQYQQSPFHHPPPGTPSYRQDGMTQVNSYTPSPQSNPSSVTNHFGPALRESPSQMPPPRESPNSWGSRQTSATSAQTPTIMHASAPRVPPHNTTKHSESPPVANGRSSLSVSPKTKPVELPKAIPESSNGERSTYRQQEPAVSRVKVEAQKHGEFKHFRVDSQLFPPFHCIDSLCHCPLPPASAHCEAPQKDL